MYHPIYKITSIDILNKYCIAIKFSDGARKEIDLEPILIGEMYGPLRDEKMFSKAEIDPEVGTLQWPNGADFDPAVLYHWEDCVNELTKRASGWH